MTVKGLITLTQLTFEQCKAWGTDPPYITFDSPQTYLLIGYCLLEVLPINR